MSDQETRRSKVSPLVLWDILYDRVIKTLE